MGDMLRNAFSVGGSNKTYATSIDNCPDVALDGIIALVGISIQRGRGATRMSFIGRVANIEAGEGKVPIERIGNLAMNKWNQLSKTM